MKPRPYGEPPVPESGRYRDVVFADIPGFRPLLLDLTVPRPGVPVVVWIHGGAWLHGSHRATADSPPWLHDLPARVLDAGFAFASVQYRLSGETAFPGQLHDVKAAVRWLRAFGPDLGLDVERIAVWGESAGGHLAALVALTAAVPESEGTHGVTGVGSGVRAAVDFYGPTDLARMQAQSPPGSALDHDASDSPESLLLGHPVRADPARADAASPLAYATGNAPPMLIVHGERDRLVPFDQSRVLGEALRARGAPVEFLPVPDADHVFAGVDPTPVIDHAIDFLGRVL
ncbi:acetyl esterase/lipase [Saccharothrix tamanrassetensis]|uniref:Acetyl esterase/lipase n=1 Tax=Saccharothrix tamanrassetensis TaxID=1051531 RepID=A0A841CMX7_9PSEU|nr:alpha/beta hydrolase [Saccharothrix tamanrassetensis]MBB5957478.1 acetyl esterase/lipase [Saccharothrix tamanrassetensis]